MSEALSEALFNEAFNIITSNKSKSNSLRQSLLQNLSYNDDPNSKVIGFLGEFEYDLNSLYDILKDLQLSYYDIHNNLNKSNSFIDFHVSEENKPIGKTYSIISGKYKNNQNNFSKINNYYINSPINKELNKSMQRSTSCKSYMVNSDENNYEKVNLVRNKYNYRNNVLSLSKTKSPKLNFDYDAYFTEYPLNKTSKNNVGSYFDFLNRSSNNDKEKSPIKNNGRNINENMDANNNKDNQELEDNNVKNNNIFTFSEQKNKNNQEFNNNIRMDNIDNNKNNNNLNDNNLNYFKQKEQQEINDQPNEMIDNNVPLTYVYRRKSEEEEIEEQKKEIIKNIISEIFQDTTKLYFLKKELGEDIGEKLLSGNITEKELYKVVKELKKIQENNLRKKKLFTKKKFNQPSDKILLKQKLSNKRYNFREFPRGWSSTKDYFINNGTPLIKDKRYKK